MTTTLSNGVLVEKQRISSIDVVRGVVMVIMALDHVRDFFHVDASLFNPTDMTKTNPALFFTRWITHFCAPTFVMLAGTSIRISTFRKSPGELSKFLLTRGLWLILLEHTVMRFGILFNLFYDVFIFQVIWAIGASMIVMAALIHLPKVVMLVLGLVITLGHNLLDGIRLQPGDAGFWPWAFTNQIGLYEILPGRTAFIHYPVLAWLGIMIMGYLLGDWYGKTTSPEQRQKNLLITGFAAIAVFILLRSGNFYGDPAPWSEQKNFIFSVMSFLNCTKYPPSLLYTLMTLGPVLIVLALLEKLNTTRSPFIVYGRVPLFYYVLHFYLAHFLALVLQQLRSDTPWSDVDFHFSKTLGGITPGSGVPLVGVYIAWVIVVMSLYPVCRWYNRYKSTHSHWWLSYL